MNSGGFELSTDQSVEQPVPSVELPRPPIELPNGGKSMEELIKNLEDSEPRPETGRKSMAEVIENLERMQPQESSRESVQETTAGGIIRDAISKLSDALFSPKVKDTGGAMRDMEAIPRERSWPCRICTTVPALPGAILRKHSCCRPAHRRKGAGIGTVCKAWSSWATKSSRPGMRQAQRNRRLTTACWSMCCCQNRQPVIAVCWGWNNGRGRIPLNRR